MSQGARSPIRMLSSVIALTLAVGSCVVVSVDDHQALAQASPALPIDMPSSVTSHASAKKVFAHYFTPFVISLDNKAAAADYYSTGYLAASGEGGAHASSGGFIRQRPLPRPVSSSPTWALEDMETDVLRAAAAGIDGFTVDLLALCGYNWDRVKLLITAAHAVDPGFRIVLMPDVTAGVASDPQALAAAVAGLASDPTVYHLADGRLVISPFDAEGRSAGWWQSWMSTMQSQYGVSVAFVPTFLDFGYAAAFAPFSYGFSIWGDRSPNSIGWSAVAAASAHALGKIWMQPVAVQDERPTQGIYTEADNTETLRGSWDIANGQHAEWVQMLTWNDYSEGTEFSPSSHTGWSPLDISAYYIAKFKLGAAPPIVRDVVYVSHRIQPAAALPTGGQSVLMNLRAGSNPARDQVEVLAFLINPATIVVHVGAASYQFGAPAGQSSFDVPLGAGVVSASISYPNGATLNVTSPNPVVARPAVQDLQYYFASSARDGSTAGTLPTAVVAAAAGSVAVAVPPIPAWVRS
ncbi:MAG: hypothetical protein JWN39_3934 [Ilumatobacteraceae bacterium]|nr:hypothetical protein [Ilumatobacteraceae bacterium]